MVYTSQEIYYWKDLYVSIELAFGVVNIKIQNGFATSTIHSGYNLGTLKTLCLFLLHIQ
ncbi:hypothetical protein [Helicobacter muridarum]|uniref:hypothetical protein n=1 Tax=Helicobacter muridarum TaxID=216 RepID=UPI000A907567|nr:hypothetical protein [Helicobacter muridarum]